MWRKERLDSQIESSFSLEIKGYLLQIRTFKDMESWIRISHQKLRGVLVVIVGSYYFIFIMSMKAMITLVLLVSLFATSLTANRTLTFSSKCTGKESVMYSFAMYGPAPTISNYQLIMPVNQELCFIDTYTRKTVEKASSSKPKALLIKRGKCLFI